MSKTSKHLRSQAAKQLRESRNGGSRMEKARNHQRAAAFKTLAQNEEWLAGEQPRPQKLTLGGPHIGLDRAPDSDAPRGNGES